MLPGFAKRLNFYPRSPCGERPACHNGQLLGIYHFYPRSPCGERLKCAICRIKVCIFLSTLSLRRATIVHRRGFEVCCYFYPRSPCGERPGRITSNGTKKFISIHALLAESDTALAVRLMYNLLFLSTLSLRRATYLHQL